MLKKVLRNQNVTVPVTVVGFIVLALLLTKNTGGHQFGTKSELQQQIEQTDIDILKLIKKRQELVLKEKGYNMTNEATDAKIVDVANYSLSIGLDRNVAVNTYYAMLSSFTELKLYPTAQD